MDLPKSQEWDAFDLLCVGLSGWEFDNCRSLSYAYILKEECESIWLTIFLCAHKSHKMYNIYYKIL